MKSYQKKAESMCVFTIATSRNFLHSDFFIWELGNGRNDFMVTHVMWESANCLPIFTPLFSLSNSISTFTWAILCFKLKDICKVPLQLCKITWPLDSKVLKGSVWDFCKGSYKKWSTLLFPLLYSATWDADAVAEALTGPLGPWGRVPRSKGGGEWAGRHRSLVT